MITANTPSCPTRAAMQAGWWNGKYANMDQREYFDVGVASWSDDDRVNDRGDNHVHLRLALLESDPGLAALCREVFGDAELKYPESTVACEKGKAAGDCASVLAPTGTPMKHDGLATRQERFAGGAEAFFYRNGFYPFVRAEMKEYDPTLHDLLRKTGESA